MKNGKRLIIIGANGHGKVCVDIAQRMNLWNQLSFLDDNMTIKKCLDYEVIGKVEEFRNYLSTADFFIGIGNNAVRKQIFKQLQSLNANIVTLIHPGSIIGKNVEIGNGTVIMAGVVINSDTTIGKCCVINTCSSVDHDNNIGDFVHIAPGAHLSGTVSVGNNSWIGVGSTLINNIDICENTVIGAGAVVLDDINEAGTYVGVPVRFLK